MPLPHTFKKTADSIEDMKNVQELNAVSSSKYSSKLDKLHDFHDDANKKVINCFKLERPKATWLNGFLDLKSKMYILGSGCDKQHKRQRITKTSIKCVRVSDNRNCLMNNGDVQNVPMYQRKWNLPMYRRTREWVFRKILHQLSVQQKSIPQRSVLTIRV